MNVGILGSGDVGQALGNGFVSRGHSVKLGAREAGNEKTAAWAAKHPGKGSAGTFREAAAFGEMLVLATHWSGTENALSLAGSENFKGKVVLDVTNPLVFEPGQPPRLALGHTDSGGEQVQRWLPEARVVKVFNSVGNAHMVDPKFPGGPPTMFLCGNDAFRARRRRPTSARRSAGRPSTSAGSRARASWSRSASCGSSTAPRRAPGTTPSSS